MSDYYSESVADLPLFTAPRAAPAQQHSRTSMAAADSMDGDRLNSLQRSVVAFLLARGDHGATDEEMQLGIPMPPSTQRPRRIELVRRGLVVEAGTRKARSGRFATAWRLA
jgi:hypothetical protein